MIGYFVKTGGENTAFFSDYIWRENGFKTILDKYLVEQSFGSDLNLLLIKYIVDGDILTFKTIKRNISAYSTQNKDISVDINVRNTDFLEQAELERRNYIVQSTLSAVNTVEKQVAVHGLVVDFELLRIKIKLAAKEFFSIKTTCEKVLEYA